MSVRKSTAGHVRRHPPTGFGLIELMITIAIVAILTAIALPSYQQSIKSNRVTTDANDFISAVNIARNEAISKGRPVSVCASANGTSCDSVIAADWSNGWMVFTDYSTSGVVDAGAGDTVVRIWGKVNTNDTVTSGGVGYIKFDRSGSAKIGDGGALSATFNVTPAQCQANEQRVISVTKLGRAAATTNTGTCT